jgi:hypothetical protein
MRWGRTGSGAPISKGWFRSGDGARIDPLTISDAFSRYLLRSQAVEKTDTERVRAIKSHGHFRWKKQDVFLSEVLWGEPVGLLPADDGTYTVYFAHLPLARFDARTCTLSPLTNRQRVKHDASGPGQACPGPEDKNKNLPEKEKLSGMCPV